MNQPVVGSAEIAAGRLTRHTLRSRFTAVHKDIYVASDVEMTAVLRAKALWLRSRGRGVLAGYSASALHGANWIDARRPAAVIDTNRRPVKGVHVREERIEDDEICVIGDMRVTTPARTALDLATHYPLDQAVAAIDSLARATHLKKADVDLLVERYRGRRGIRQARSALDLVDAGAESPRETWLRLVLIGAGFPRPQTQIPIFDEYGQLVAKADMGWEEIKVAVDYEGEHHRTPKRFAYDIRRYDTITGLGWIDIRVTSQDTEAGIIRRVGEARARRL